MTNLVVLVPVLNRPANVAPLLASLAATTPEARVLWICDPGDTAEQDAIALAGGTMISPGGSYASKINHGVRVTDEPLIMIAADDLEFQSEWLAAATAKLTDNIQVVGVNDLIERPRRPRHATHFLITRDYARLPCIDRTPGPLCELYDHSAVDDELIATATYRRMYAYARDAHVQHLHWMNKAVEDDPTYKKGRANFHQDMRLFRRRSRLWRA